MAAAVAVTATGATMRAMIDELRRRGWQEPGAEPVLRDAGVWREGRAYQRGCVVTVKGTSWVCQETGTTDRPGSGGGSGWRLMAKTRG